MSGGLWRQIVEDYSTNGKDWTKPGLHAIVTYRFGAWAISRRRNTFARRVSGFLYGIIYKVAHIYVRNLYGIELHRTATIGKNVTFAHQGGIVIHNFAHIGDDCIIRHGVTLGNAGRGVTPDEAPRVGSGVSIGTGSVIVGKVTVGDDVQIGPNVVIYTDIPAGATVVANSPRLIYAPKARLGKELKEMKSRAAEPDS